MTNRPKSNKLPRRKTQAHYYVDGVQYALSISPVETIGAKPGSPEWHAEAKVIYCEDQMRMATRRGDRDTAEVWRQNVLAATAERDAPVATSL